MPETAPTTIEEALEQNAMGPASASGDSGSITQHSLQDQIAAAKYVAGEQAKSSTGLGLTFRKLVPPGAV